MADIDKFHEWVETQSPLALREYMFAQAAWQARGEEIKQLNQEKDSEVIDLMNVIQKLTAKLDKARDGDCCTEGCIKCDARKILAETQEPTEQAPCEQPFALAEALEHCDGADCTCYAYYQGECCCGADWTPSEVIKARHILNTTPSREWQSLSDDEIGRLAVFDGLHHVEIPLLAKFIIAIEKALREKNNA